MAYDTNLSHTVLLPFFEIMGKGLCIYVLHCLVASSVCIFHDAVKEVWVSICLLEPCLIQVECELEAERPPSLRVLAAGMYMCAACVACHCTARAFFFQPSCPIPSFPQAPLLACCTPIIIILKEPWHISYTISQSTKSKSRLYNILRL